MPTTCPDCFDFDKETRQPVWVEMEVKVYRQVVMPDDYFDTEPYIVQCPRCKRIEEV